MNPPLTHPRVLADIVAGSAVRDALLVVGGAALVGAAAQVAVPLPFTPVPLTLQTFAVLLVAASLGWRRAVPSMALYAVVGLAGVPWFAGGSSGYPGASFGYVVGFVAAAGIVGRLAARGADRKPVSSLTLMVLGGLAIYAIGVPWLAVSLSIGLGQALSLGVVPFLLGDAFKTLLAGGLLPAVWKLVDRTQTS